METDSVGLDGSEVGVVDGLELAAMVGLRLGSIVGLLKQRRIKLKTT